MKTKRTIMVEMNLSANHDFDPEKIIKKFFQYRTATGVIVNDIEITFGEVNIQPE